MGAGHGARDVEHVAAGDSPVHRLDARVKIVGLLGTTVAAVSTPQGAWFAFTAYLAVLLALVVAARLPARHVLGRMAIEVPFLLAAALLPLTRPDGAELGATLALKATVGTLAAVLLSSTTPFPRLLRGFERLRAPRTLVLIVSFMWRYLQVLSEELARMRRARDSRAVGSGPIWRDRSTARLVAVLFLRALERGERVYLAMLSRGFTGAFPALPGDASALRRADAAGGAALVAAVVAIRVALA